MEGGSKGGMDGGRGRKVNHRREEGGQEGQGREEEEVRQLVYRLAICLQMNR